MTTSLPADGISYPVSTGRLDTKAVQLTASIGLGQALNFPEASQEKLAEL